jgi:hypothetical protein
MRYKTGGQRQWQEKNTYVKYITRYREEIFCVRGREKVRLNEVGRGVGEINDAALCLSSKLQRGKVGVCFTMNHHPRP